MVAAMYALILYSSQLNYIPTIPGSSRENK